MIDLDEKLTNIYYGDDVIGVAGFIGIVKQAFEETGWVQIPPLQATKGFVITKGGTAITIKPSEVMTGEDWLKRFEEELAKLEYEYRGGSHPDGEL